MAVRYSKEVYEFVKDNVEKHTNKELAQMVNSKFDTQFTAESMKSYIGNHKLYRKSRAGYRTVYSKTFPEEIAKYIQENYCGIGPKEMALILNSRFGSNYTREQLSTYYKNHNLNSGLTGYFSKGHVPANKGKPMPEDQYKKCAATMFQKGNIPHNHMQVGEYTHTSDGYLVRKIQEEGIQRERFEFVHRATWKKHFGPIPEGEMVSFLDGDKDNCDIENLVLMDNSENLEMNRSKLRFKNAESTKSGLAVAKVKIAVRNRRKNAGNNK